MTGFVGQGYRHVFLRKNNGSQQKQKTNSKCFHGSSYPAEKSLSPREQVRLSGSVSPTPGQKDRPARDSYSVSKHRPPASLLIMVCSETMAGAAETKADEAKTASKVVCENFILLCLWLL